MLLMLSSRRFLVVAGLVVLLYDHLLLLDSEVCPFKQSLYVTATPALDSLCLARAVELVEGGVLG